MAHCGILVGSGLQRRCDVVFPRLEARKFGTVLAHDRGHWRAAMGKSSRGIRVCAAGFGIFLIVVLFFFSQGNADTQAHLGTEPDRASTTLLVSPEPEMPEVSDIGQESQVDPAPDEVADIPFELDSADLLALQLENGDAAVLIAGIPAESSQGDAGLNWPAWGGGAAVLGTSTVVVASYDPGRSHGGPPAFPISNEHPDPPPAKPLPEPRSWLAFLLGLAVVFAATSGRKPRLDSASPCLQEFDQL